MIIQKLKWLSCCHIQIDIIIIVGVGIHQNQHNETR